MKQLLKPITLAASAILFASVPATHAVNVVISAIDTSEIEAFLAANFTDAVVTAGNFAVFSSSATTAALAANGGADLVIIGRSLSSGEYGSGAADGYNGLTIPVISFTSYVARELGNRMGWHTGSANHLRSVTGDETTLTVAGATFFGDPVGTIDYYSMVAGDTFNGLGSGAGVGGGDVLATIGGDLLAAHWDIGDAPGNPTNAGVATFPGERLLFNLDNDPSPTGEFTNLSEAGTAALITGLVKVGGLTAIPEPSGFALFGLGALGLIIRRRR